MQIVLHVQIKSSQPEAELGGVYLIGGVPIGKSIHPRGLCGNHENLHQPEGPLGRSFSPVPLGASLDRGPWAVAPSTVRLVLTRTSGSIRRCGVTPNEPSIKTVAFLLRVPAGVHFHG